MDGNEPTIIERPAASKGDIVEASETPTIGKRLVIKIIETTNTAAFWEITAICYKEFRGMSI